MQIVVNKACFSLTALRDFTWCAETSHSVHHAGDLLLLDTTKDLIHGALSSPHAGKGGLANGEALDQQADDEFSSEVSAAIVDWIAKRMSDYHKNFHDTQLMQVWLMFLSGLMPPLLQAQNSCYCC